MDDHSDLPWKPTNVKEDPDWHYAIPVILVGSLFAGLIISGLVAIFAT